MYQQVVNERSTMKIDLSIAEKKATRKEEKIVQLENTVNAMREKVRYTNFKHFFIAKTL